MLTIGEFSRICRVSVKTIRYYDQIGLLKPRQVSRDSGYRYYETAQLQDMLLIQRLKRYGFSLPEVAAALSARNPEALRQVLLEKRDAFLRDIQSQQHVLLQMERDILKIERRENIMQTNYIIKTVQMQPKSICSVRRTMSLKDFNEAFGALCAVMEKNQLRPVGPFLSVYHDEDFNPESADIEVGAEVADTAAACVRKLNPGLCCTATHIGPYDDFSPCYAALSEWIEREGYAVSGPPFELYVKGCESGVVPDDYVTEIYIPIRPAR